MYFFDETELKREIGKMVCARRKALNLSQEKLAEIVGIKVRTLSKIENGYTFITAKTLCEMCKVFNIEPKTFFDIGESTTISNIKLNDIIEKLKTYNSQQLNLYYELINFIDTKYNEK